MLEGLKQEVGQSSEQETWLNIRFTHDEIASASGTIRVTITRLLRKWRQQGWLSLSGDGRRPAFGHRQLILNDEYF